MGALMRAHDWTRSPLGPIESWRGSLRSVVSLLLASKFPMFVAWGPELRLLYNDAYAEILGEKHPAALGERLDVVLAEIWPDLAPLTEAAIRGEATYSDDLPLVMNRHGYDEQVWFTFSYSPIETKAGEVAGMFCACVETTSRVREDQRRTFLAELDERLRDLEDASEILTVSAEALGRHLGADRVHWAAIDVAQDNMELGHEWIRSGVATVAGNYRLSALGSGLLAEMNAGRLVAIENWRRDPIARENRMKAASGREASGTLCAPLLRGGVWQAAISVHTLAPRRWREDERQLIREVAERAWTRAERARAEARVRSREARLRALVSAANDALYRMSPDWSELRTFDEPDFSIPSPDPYVTWVDDLVPPEERPRVRVAIQAAVATGAQFELEHRARLQDGSTGWILSRAVPVRDEHGEIIEWFGAATNVTAEHQARQALEETAERLQLATEAAEVGFWDYDPLADAAIWSPRMRKMLGLSPDEPITEDLVYSALHPDDRDRVREAFATALNPGQRAPYDIELRTVCPRGGRSRWLAAKARAIFDRKGRCVRVIGAAIDITDRKEAEVHLRLMVNELNHRVKNSLATVQAIISQTLRPGTASDEVRQAVAARLVALAEAHDVLTDEKWSGAELAELAGQAAAPYVGLSGDSPFEISGPRVFLPPKTAIALALAFHELATNAAKYGALSVSGGEVQIRWSVNRQGGARKLRLIWSERGGPEVRAPRRAGFGTRLIQRGLACELQGQVGLDFQPSGLVCTMDALLPEARSEGWSVDLQLS